MSADTLRMLERGNTAEVSGFTQLLGRQPRPFIHALRNVPPTALLAEALWSWGEPLLRIALASVWLITAWVSVAVHPVSDSLGMLARVGLSGAFAYAALWSASALDAVLGILTLVRPSRALWIAQIVLIAAYSALIAWRLPEMWTHPFGPLLKNVPILAILALLWAATARKV